MLRTSNLFSFRISTPFLSSSATSLALLDPPFSPVYRDERTERKNIIINKKKKKEITSSSTSSDDSSYFLACCRDCGFKLFDSDGKLKGNPAWPTFYKVFNPKRASSSSSSSGLAAKPETRLTLRNESVDNAILFHSKNIRKRRMNNPEEDEQDRKTGTKRSILSNEKAKKKSLILLDEPPVMRWDLSASIQTPQGITDNLSDTQKRFYRREERLRKRYASDTFVSPSKQLRTIHQVRNSPSITRGHCKNCDLFICVVLNELQRKPQQQASSPSLSSPIVQKYVCRPSSLILR